MHWIGSGWGTRGWVIAGMLAAWGISLFVSEAVFHRAPIVTDEISYLFQAYTFRDGQLVREVPPLAAPFQGAHDMLVLEEDIGWVSRYPPGHALWLVLGVVMGNPYWIVAVGSGLGIGIILLAVGACRGSRPAAVLFLLVSPFYVFVHGTLLSHTSGFLAAALLLGGYMRWQTSDRQIWALVAGLGWAWLFINRPYTASLMAIPFAIDALRVLAIHPSRAHVKGTLMFALFALSGVVVYMAYHHAILGHPLASTYLTYNAGDALGFGLRGTELGLEAWGDRSFTFVDGLRQTGTNLLLLDQWLLGFPGGLIGLAVLSVVGWSKRWSPLLISIPLVISLGSIFFWYPGWNLAGPVYWFETLPALVVLAAVGIRAVGEGRGPGLLRNRAFLIPVAVLAGGMWCVFVMSRVGIAREETAPRREYLDVLASLPPQSLALVSGEVFEAIWPLHEFLYNPRGMDSEVLVAKWQPGTGYALVHGLSNHTPYRVVMTDQGLEARPFLRSRSESP